MKSLWLFLILLLAALALLSSGESESCESSRCPAKLETLPAGTQQVTVYAAGDTSTPVIDAPVELAAGGAYTIAAVGLVTDGSIAAQVYQDDLSAPTSGNAKVRIVHSSPVARPPRRHSTIPALSAIANHRQSRAVPPSTGLLDFKPSLRTAARAVLLADGVPVGGAAFVFVERRAPRRHQQEQKG